MSVVENSCLELAPVAQKIPLVGIVQERSSKNQMVGEKKLKRRRWSLATHKLRFAVASLAEIVCKSTNGTIVQCY